MSNDGRKQSDSQTNLLIKQLLKKGIIRAIDKAFGEFLIQLSNREGIDWVAILGTITSQQSGQQHSCVDLRELHLSWSYTIALPPVDVLVSALTTDPRVCTLPDNEPKPLVLNGSLLYLQKYWHYETSLVERLAFFANQSANLHANDIQCLQQDLNLVFPREPNTTQEINWQKVAVALAAIKPFSIITGGPGTGKTTTVAKLLWLLSRQSKGERFVVKLAAPTGKAAARLTESLREATKRLPITEGVELPDECTTIHRLLGVKRHSPNFQHNEQNPLRLDLLVVDEASMIDLPLLSKLFNAIPEHARIVLLGDNNQLASVEVGSVLGDICSVKTNWGTYTSETCSLLNKVCQEALAVDSLPNLLSDNLVYLQKSYRFDAQSGIGQLAKSINSGDFTQVLQLLESQLFSDIQWLEQLNHSFLIEQVSTHWETYFKAAKLGEGKRVFEALSKLQVLCMQRAGPWGIENINQLLEMHFNQQGWIDARTEYYPGRPVMIVENNHRLGLYNGDIGVVLPSPEVNPDEQKSSLLRVWFLQADGSFKHYLSGQLPKHETVYAMTTHKSQGSEFDKVILCMPAPETEQQKALLSRELFYTGVTRAKKECVLMAEKTAINHAVRRRCLRASGISSQLTS